MLIADKVSAEGEVIDGSLLTAKIVDANLCGGDGGECEWEKVSGCCEEV